MDFTKISDKFNERKIASKSSDLDTLIEEMSVSDSACDLPIDAIDVFTDESGRTQPFEIDEHKISALQTSISQNGQLEPIIVRELENGRYQMLAGHHRLEACKKNEMKTILARIIECDDWNAYRIMVESNIKHGNPKPSDIAKILVEYRLHGNEFDEKLTNTMLSEMLDISERQVYRYFKLAQLHTDIVSLIDSRYISTNSVDDILPLRENQQQILAKYVCMVDKRLNVSACKKAAAFLTGEPNLSAEELDERMSAKSNKKKYKNAVFNSACDDLRLAAKMQEQSEEELSELVIKLLTEHFKLL